MAKPPWETTLPGRHPGMVPPLSPKLEGLETDYERIRRAAFQASELADSRFRGRDTVFINQTTNAEKTHRENLDALLTAQNGHIMSGESVPGLVLLGIATHRRYLARALYQLGMFDEALKYAYPEQAEYVRALKVADAIPDDDDCGCPREVVDGLELPRHSLEGIEPILSPSRGTVLTVHGCRHCGHLNIHDGSSLARNAMIKARRQRGGPQADDTVILDTK